MAFAAETHFGTYQVAGLIGVGEIGEVYRATDTALGREVAIKVLPGSFASDADRARSTCGRSPTSMPGAGRFLPPAVFTRSGARMGASSSILLSAVSGSR
jgi:serine/threonine protein kinase